MASFIYKHSERNNDEYKALLMRKLFPKGTQDDSCSPKDSPLGIQIGSMNQRQISDRAYPSDHTPTFSKRDLERLIKSDR